MVVGKFLSFWKGLFSGPMLVLGRVKLGLTKGVGGLMTSSIPSTVLFSSGLFLVVVEAQ